MATIHPIKISGRWKEGFALDYHTVSSEFVGYNEFGHPMFDTRYTELGELLHRLKFRNDATGVAAIIEAAATFLSSWKPKTDLIVAVPPSKARPQQPVLLLAQALAEKVPIPFESAAVTRIKEVPELKNIVDYAARVAALRGAHQIEQSRINGKSVLLFDDLFRSGATMNSITEGLYDSGRAANVFALTITCTRVKR